MEICVQLLLCFSAVQYGSIPARDPHSQIMVSDDCGGGESFENLIYDELAVRVSRDKETEE